MKEHKHAAVLRAIADGVPMDEFETKSNMCVDDWSSIASRAHWVIYPDEYEVRRKPQHIIVNGFKVPKPLGREPSLDDVFFYVSFDSNDLYKKDTWTDHAIDRRVLERGIAHATKKAAIAHAKAMLGIDPEAA